MTAEGKPRVEKVTHRGIRWQRAPSGRTRWWNEELGEWVRYASGDDAPPRPPGWEAPQAAPPLTRPRWKSPYRIVPIVLAVAVVIAGLVQALRPNTSAAGEARQAKALMGKCLHRTGVSHGVTTYNANPVACSSSQADVKVVAVVATTPGSPSCPSGTTSVQLLSGVTHPHLECVAPVRR